MFLVLTGWHLDVWNLNSIYPSPPPPSSLASCEVIIFATAKVKLLKLYNYCIIHLIYKTNWFLSENVLNHTLPYLHICVHMDIPFLPFQHIEQKEEQGRGRKSNWIGQDREKKGINKIEKPTSGSWIGRRKAKQSKRKKKHFLEAQQLIELDLASLIVHITYILLTLS